MNAIILSNEELEQRIEKKAIEIVRKFLAQSTVKKTNSRKTNLDMDEGIEHLNSIGYKCSRSLITKKTMNEEIPFSKFNRRISFNADELTEWVETQKNKTVDITGNVSRSAIAKLKKY